MGPSSCSQWDEAKKRKVDSPTNNEGSPVANDAMDLKHLLDQQSEQMRRMQSQIDGLVAINSTLQARHRLDDQAERRVEQVDELREKCDFKSSATNDWNAPPSSSCVGANECIVPMAGQGAPPPLRVDEAGFGEAGECTLLAQDSFLIAYGILERSQQVGTRHRLEITGRLRHELARLGILHRSLLDPVHGVLRRAHHRPALPARLHSRLGARPRGEPATGGRSSRRRTARPSALRTRPWPS
ncbi:hypothetical protein THAOC_28178 [Thalassiosira oceanica]|uniref:Uncharacterized protein n=1 Tax=Thalassiosira oceanica TaxID=159749 RepID=K0RH02_THAOC|nr:hypothetical protein THAOC_28178 [Thalassiosira oceanica]|eukprot:EJK52530.1 hypothetical protein THAOC_28178 [Thalassiosira oceanica]